MAVTVKSSLWHYNALQFRENLHEFHWMVSQSGYVVLCVCVRARMHKKTRYYFPSVLQNSSPFQNSFFSEIWII
jgi:hypothetical protein